ncbi:MAG TPA: T9SS type A sorting domain-containing protein [Chitinophagales bacterium]|nr:T9SS type A sorting domain-containing protein [Chitinophagales bacterium]
MKKQALLLMTLLTILNFKSSGQIIFEHAYSTYHSQFYLTDIGNSNYKYVLFTENSLIVNLYNLDHSLYLSFTTPDTLWIPPYYLEVQYITKSLFDCDSNNIEYVLTRGAYTAGGFRIYRTDGTLLFSKDSVSGPYCYGCGDGSVIIRPIENTPDGTKLMLSKGNGSIGDSTYIYSLCGILPLIVDENSITVNYVKIFPNPTNEIITFEINPPSNQEQFVLTIYNSSFQIVEEKKLTDKNYQLDINKHSLASGTYLFDLRTDRKVFQTGKFVITK